MSGKYDLVRAAYSADKDDMRGEMLFKATYQQSGRTLTIDPTSELGKNFFTGRTGWEVPVANAIIEIENAITDGFNALSTTPLVAAHRDLVIAAMKELPKANDTSADEHLVRIARLYNTAFEVTVGGTGTKYYSGGNIPAGVQVAVINKDHTDNRKHPAIFNSALKGGAVAPTGAKRFNYNMERLLSPPTKGLSGDEIYGQLITGSQKIVDFEGAVRRDEDGELELNVNGKFEKVSKLRRDMCEAVAADGTKGSCQAIADSCLTSTNTDGKPVALTEVKCLDVLAKTSTGLWKADKNSVKVMNPRAAFSLLKNLGYKGKKDGNTIKCEPVDEWLERVKKNELTDDNGKEVKLADVTGGTPSPHTIAMIQSYCAAMKPFLELVVGYVDANPAILNQGSGHSTGSIATNDPFGLKRPQGNNKDGSLSDMRNQAVTGLDHVHVYVSGLMAALGQNPLISLSGGAVVPGYLAPSGTAPLKQKVQRFSHRLNEVYKHYVERLNGMNKDLSQATKTKVESVFETLRGKEDELLKWVEYLERYYEVSTIEGDLTSKRISKKDLEDAYQKYEKNLGKLRKRTVNVIDILATLSNATNDAESGSQVNLPSSA